MSDAETKSSTVTYRCLGVQRVPGTYATLHVLLVEHDPERPDKQPMRSIVVPVPDSGPWQGIEAGDLIEVTRVAKPEGGR